MARPFAPISSTISVAWLGGQVRDVDVRGACVAAGRPGGARPAGDLDALEAGGGGPVATSVKGVSGNGAVRRPSLIGHLKHVITAAEAMGIPYVNTFMGGDGAKHQDANWEEALRVWPDIVAFAQNHGRTITIENCPMLFSLDEWPGGHNLATTPRIWRRILEEWGGTIGLNFDPSHLILQMIDIARFIREFGPHILHIQAKDLTDRS